MERQMNMGKPEKTYIEEYQLTNIKTTGSITDIDVIYLANDFYQGDCTRNLLADFSSSSLVDVRPSRIPNILKITTKEAPRRRGGKTAIVVSKLADYGMARMFVTRSEIAGVPLMFGVFNSFQDAMDWVKA